MTEFDLKYQEALRQIMEEGIEEINERTGHKTKALPGITFSISKGLPVLTLRRIPVRIFVAEQIWFLTGSRRPGDFLTKFTKIWDDFTNVDGVVSTAYGYRWRQHFGRDQITGLVDLLEKQPSSRHGVVITWDPADDGLASSLGGRYKKNVPCPFCFVVNIIGGKLNLHNIVRSNDMILGCPHDVGGFGVLQHILAARLGVGVGTYTHTISNAHVYDIHYEAAWELIKRKNEHPEIKLKPEKDWLTRGTEGDESLVEEILGQIKEQYKPMSAIEGLKIVL
ncbi:MAG: thymidylate synthase [Candidatus Shapirobacteria bacterium]|jgi:thymidylate synthase